MDSKKSAISTFSVSGHIGRVVAGVFIVALLAACGAGKPSSNVAVLDLDKLAEETGYGREIKTKISQLQTDLKSKLGAVESSLTTQIKDKREAMGKKPSRKQKEELEQMTNQARMQMQQAQREVATALQKQSASLVSQLHELVRPVAREMAQKRGMDIVMIRNRSILLDYSPEVDITDEVIQEVLKRKLVPVKEETEEEAAPAASEPVAPAESTGSSDAG